MLTNYGNSCAPPLFFDKLNLNSTFNWSSQALDDVIRCQPPANHEFKKFEKWLNKFLKYPGAVISIHWVAAKLGVTVKSLQRALEHDTTLSAKLRQCRYKGTGYTTADPRWWAAGVNTLWFDIRKQVGVSLDKFHKMLNTLSGMTLNPAKSRVVALDKTLKPLPEMYSDQDLVQVLPYKWPSWANPAYMPIDIIKSNTALWWILEPYERYKL